MMRNAEMVDTQNESWFFVGMDRFKKIGDKSEECRLVMIEAGNPAALILELLLTWRGTETGKIILEQYTHNGPFTVQWQEAVQP